MRGVSLVDLHLVLIYQILSLLLKFECRQIWITELSEFLAWLLINAMLSVVCNTGRSPCLSRPAWPILTLKDFDISLSVCSVGP